MPCLRTNNGQAVEPGPTLTLSELSPSSGSGSILTSKDSVLFLCEKSDK